MKPIVLYTLILELIILGLLAAIYMAGVALDHNPQDEFYDTGSHVVVTENLLPMMASWFAAVAILWLVLRLLLAWYASMGTHTPR